MAKPVIVMAAYGTGDAEARQALEIVDSLVLKRFPGYEVRWALTARWLLAKLRKDGQTTLFTRRVPLKNLDEVYADLRAAGNTRVAVQCLLVHDGSETDLVLKAPAPGLEVKYGMPLMMVPGNLERVVKAVAPYFGKGKTATLLIGHGVEDKPELNKPLHDIDAIVRKNYRNVFMTSIHGLPGTNAIADVKKAGCTDVVFVPLMLTTGEHILHEVVADTPDSWKSRLGLPYRIAPNFSQNPAILDLYMDSLGKVLAEFK